MLIFFSVVQNSCALNIVLWKKGLLLLIFLKNAISDNDILDIFLLIYFLMYIYI